MASRIAVFGTGYLGATHAACMAELGHEVLGVDVDVVKIARLAKGDLPFFEPGLARVLEENIKAGRLNFTTSYADAAEFADIHFLAVATPQQRNQLAADLSQVESVIQTLSPLLSRPTVIFGKSTVPVGTAAHLGQVARSLAPAGEVVEVAWNPEFLREGFAVQDTLLPDRIVLGVDTGHASRAVQVACEIYGDILAKNVPLLVTDLETSELVKMAANAFLATKISFINAMAEVCEAAGADVTQLADAIGYDDRIGRRFLNAGIGFGGGCLPKDIRAFAARAAELGANHATKLLQEIDSINTRSRSRMVAVTREVLEGPIAGSRIAILGAAFKPDSDDTRDSPSLSIAAQLHGEGAVVTVFDPKAMSNGRLRYPQLQFASGSREACLRADVVLVLTEWREFRELKPDFLEGVVHHRKIIDGRNCLDRSKWLDAGWSYRGVGR